MTARFWRKTETAADDRGRIAPVEIALAHVEREHQRTAKQRVSSSPRLCTPKWRCNALT